MKMVLLLAFVIGAGPVLTRASNISVIDFGSLVPGGPGLSNPITNCDGSSMLNGAGLVRVGYFNTAAQSATWRSDLASGDVSRVNAALQSFIPLGENALTPNLGAVPAGTGPRFAQRVVNGVSLPGRLVGGIAGVAPVQSTPNTVNPGGVPGGSRLFLLVYADPGGNPAGQFGVFSADTWLMPFGAGLNPILNTIDVDTAAEVYVGTFGSLRLSCIPEPATATMVLAACARTVFRRRR